MDRARTGQICCHRLSRVRNQLGTSRTAGQGVGRPADCLAVGSGVREDASDQSLMRAKGTLWWLRASNSGTTI